MNPLTPDKLHTSKGTWNHRFPDSQAVLWIFSTAEVRYFAEKKEPRLLQFRTRGKGKITRLHPVMLLHISQSNT
jgi:hypothetical protein